MAYFLLSYRSGAEGRAAIRVGERIYDVARLTGEPRYVSVLGILADWQRAQSVLNQFALAADASEARISPLDTEVELLSPILYPGQIFASGANFADYLAEMSAVTGEPAVRPGNRPWHFIKPSRACVTGPGSHVKLPAFSNAVDWEIELAVVIGKAATNVPVENALSYVAGYTIANDLSARDMIREDTPPTSPFRHDWIAAKGFSQACPIGPWIAPASQITDPQSLSMRLWVEDELMQDSNTSRMIFGVAEQIAFLSSRLTLNPGDVILTGTPAGVGMFRNRLLRAGDTLRLEIEGIGELRHRVV